jgi:hypothetical protein
MIYAVLDGMAGLLPYVVAYATYMLVVGIEH